VECSGRGIILNILSWLSPEGAEENDEKLIKSSRPSGQDLNPGPQEYKVDHMTVTFVSGFRENRSHRVKYWASINHCTTIAQRQYVMFSKIGIFGQIRSTGNIISW
jgi:hypothetical protein